MSQGALKSVARNAESSTANGLTSVPQPFHESGPQGISEEAGVERVEGRYSFIAASPAMQQVRRQIEQLAAIDADVLIVGEIGTEKEAAARVFHRLSARASRPFVKVNCAAFPAEMLECELYGQEVDANSGATQMWPGKFASAEKGILFLDGLAGIPLASQPRLLHLLEEGEFARLGATRTMPCDVRIVAATEIDLRSAVQEGLFRSDLFYRLSGFTIHIPPLRDRREDLPYLLDHAIDRWSEEYKRPRLPITRRILDACAAYPWPGNIHELENFVKRYLFLGDEDLALANLEEGPALQIVSATESSLDAAGKDICDLKSVVRDLKQDAEKAAILQALERTNGNKQEAASLLHISLRALHYKVRAYGIESTSLRGSGCVGFPGRAARATQGGESTATSRITNPSGKIITMARSTVR